MITKSEIVIAIAKQIRVPGRSPGEISPATTMETLGIDSLELARILLATRNELGLRINFAILAEFVPAKCTIEALVSIFQEEE